MSTQAAPAPAVKSIVPVLIVDRVEPCVELWRDRLGFQVVAEVPHEGHLGFAMLSADDATVMYQSRASVEADLPPGATPPRDATTFLFVTVADLDAVLRALDGIPLVMERRKTFYGMEELAVRDPAGHVITFAQRI